MPLHCLFVMKYLIPPRLRKDELKWRLATRMLFSSSPFFLLSWFRNIFKDVFLRSGAHFRNAAWVKCCCFFRSNIDRHLNAPIGHRSDFLHFRQNQNQTLDSTFKSFNTFLQTSLFYKHSAFKTPSPCFHLPESQTLTQV